MIGLYDKGGSELVGFYSPHLEYRFNLDTLTLLLEENLEFGFGYVSENMNLKEPDSSRNSEYIKK